MELDLSFVDHALDRLGGNPDRVLPVLQALQRHYRYLPVDALRRVAQRSDITLAQIASVSTFYSQFRHRPVGRRLISVCNGTACHVKGAERVYDMLRDRLHIPGGDDTDASGEYTVEKVFCLGCCTLAPVVRCGESVYGPQTTDGIADLIRRIQEKGQEKGSELISATTLQAGRVPPGRSEKLVLTPFPETGEGSGHPWAGQYLPRFLLPCQGLRPSLPVSPTEPVGERRRGADQASGLRTDVRAGADDWH